MTLTPERIRHWAQYLDAGLREGRELDRITSTDPGLSIEDAYRIQAEGIHLRQARGEKVIGMKMGLTSKAKREQMGLHSPCYGVLTDRMEVRGGSFGLEGTIHPKIEPEIAFHTCRELAGQVTREQVLEACDWVSSAMEILDSRYVGFKYFSLPDVVADNSSSAWYVLGEPLRDIRSLKLDQLPMRMSVNGAVAQQALSSEISGHPVDSLVQLCALLHAEGRSLPAGSLVLAGAATVAVQLEAGQEIRLDVEGLPPTVVRVTG